jgi:uroporphyrinogen-III synthase
MNGALAARRIVVTRAREQASELAGALTAAGAVTVEVPVIAIAPPEDGGRALRHALASAHPFDWIVVTSPNSADALADAAPDPDRVDAHIAAIGTGTAARLASRGFDVTLVPERFVAEALVDAFPDPPAERQGRVLLAQAEKARRVLADGLRTRGWDVTCVVAYRTVAAEPTEGALVQLAAADAITFTSSSTVDNFVDAYGPEAAPAFVACIGPITAATARNRGLRVAVVAEPHTIDGLVASLARGLGPGSGESAP